MWRAIGLALLSSPALADSLVAARMLPARTVIAEGDVMVVDADIPGALASADAAIGQETRVAIYAGRAVKAADIGQPALVERNAIVMLVYRAGGLVITAEGRALARAGAGEVVRAMNLSSKTTVEGLVAPDGTIIVGGIR
ncbi:MAG: flagellar basal body P-ring formation protein FlgA [Tabrizicola sp.]|jgi:flagella basal body P-ring formation protein FlgA|nr:flagellar basal body P-ring formation protein FlgA [Tabrizicola sp.]